MSYLAAVQAYGSDSTTANSNTLNAAQDPAVPALAPIHGLGLDSTRQWLTALEVSPRGQTPAIRMNGKDTITQTITITDASGAHELVFTAGLLTEYTLTPP